MHYCIYLFTENEPTEEDIKKILEPYEENDVPISAPLSWDWYSIGGRFYNRLETKLGFRCSGAPVSEIVNWNDVCEGGYAFITPNGVVVPRELWLDPNQLIVNPLFKKDFETAVRKYKNGCITVIDMHS